MEAWEGWVAGRLQSSQLLSDFFPLHLLASANHLSRATLKNPGPFPLVNNSLQSVLPYEQGLQQAQNKGLRMHEFACPGCSPGESQ